MGGSLVGKEEKYHANFGTVKDSYGHTIKKGVDDGFSYTAPVKQFEPNGWGLYDMGGNVSEWVADVYRPLVLPNDNFIIGKPHIRVTSGSGPPGSQHTDDRVIKGGSWVDGSAYLLCASRAKFPENGKSSTIGFRLALISVEGSNTKKQSPLFKSEKQVSSED